jgi:DNA-binding protein Fis
MKTVRDILDELEPALSNNPAAKERTIDMKERLEELIKDIYSTGIMYGEGVREFKKRFILRALKENRGNQCKAARELGMHRNTLSRTIAELKMQEEVDQMVRHCGGRSNSPRTKLEKEYAPVHVTKLLVPRKKSTGVSSHCMEQRKEASS